MEIKNIIENGKTSLGIEFGSTRIKAILTDKRNQPIAAGEYTWENRYDHGIWTYTQEDIWNGLQDCYQDLCRDVQKKYGVTLSQTGALGFSGMMHGYLVFDAQGKLLVPFRTWRNTITGEAAALLTQELEYNIPQRWSVSHLYQAIRNGEAHVKDIAYITTLAGYIHWKLTGQKVLGVGEASGMFPIDPKTKDYDAKMVSKFDALIAEKGYAWKLRDILPQVLVAGDRAGDLSEEGAKLLDTTGILKAGIPMCPPEGDAGTGMTATNSVAKRTGNISAGTSIFSMVVLEKELQSVHEEIDLVTTPAGDLVAMVHCNNCTSDINAWIRLFQEFSAAMGQEIPGEKMDALYTTLFQKALEGEKDCGGLLSYNYYSGEPVTGFVEGRPLFVRTPDAHFTLANFMRTHLFSALATIKVGNDILLKEEGVKLDTIYGHGGLFKTKSVGQKVVAAALNTPVAVMKTAGEGGAWGIAVLASYMLRKSEGQTLDEYLTQEVFVGQEVQVEQPDPEDVQGFDAFLERYVACYPAEQAAVDGLHA